MRVLVGNRRPKVGHKQPDDTVVYETLPEGDWVTEVRAGDFANIVGALSLHFVGEELEDGSYGWVDKPAWVSCEDGLMEARLCKFWGIEDNLVPEQWSTDAN